MQEQFKQILALKGVSYRWLAQQMGTDLNRLHNIQALTKEELLEIAAILNVPVAGFTISSNQS